jgi:hypothetical protein
MNGPQKIFYLYRGLVCLTTHWSTCTFLFAEKERLFFLYFRVRCARQNLFRRTHMRTAHATSLVDLRVSYHLASLTLWP